MMVPTSDGLEKCASARFAVQQQIAGFEANAGKCRERLDGGADVRDQRRASSRLLSRSMTEADENSLSV